MNKFCVLWGKDRRAVATRLLPTGALIMAVAFFLAFAQAAEIDPARTRELLKVLQSEAAFFDKARACQQAGEFGTAELVPALAALLDDAKLSAYARSGLENIPDPSAAAALREALTRLNGDPLRGVINSLGVLRDEVAVDALIKLSADRNRAVAGETLLALGRIADRKSVDALLAALGSAPAELRADAASAALLAGQRQLELGRTALAKELYDALCAMELPAGYRSGALCGAIAARRTEGPAFLLAQLTAADADTRRAARLAAQDYPEQEVTAAISAALNSAPPEQQLCLQEALQLLYAKPLINGKRFQGWEGDTEKSFRREEEAIVGGNLKAPIPRNEFLATTRPYTNFILRAECRLVGECNAGIQIRTQRIPDHHEVSGYQADMSTGKDGGYWGKLYDESRRKKILGASLNHPQMLETLKPDGWNQYEIRCEGRRIQLFLNGIQTLDYTETDESIPQFGIIALQIHSGPPSEAWYRNIQIVELP